LTELFDAAARFTTHFMARIERSRAEDGATRLGREHVARGNRASGITARCARSPYILISTISCSRRIPAVELLNVLRPTIAASVYIVFYAHALHQYPAAAAGLRTVVKLTWTC